MEDGTRRLVLLVLMLGAVGALAAVWYSRGGALERAQAVAEVDRARVQAGSRPSQLGLRVNPAFLYYQCSHADPAHRPFRVPREKTPEKPTDPAKLADIPQACRTITLAYDARVFPYQLEFTVEYDASWKLVSVSELRRVLSASRP